MYKKTIFYTHYLLIQRLSFNKPDNESIIIHFGPLCL